MKQKKGKDIVMWVSSKHYHTIWSFKQEAKRLGVSKRIGRFPYKITLGESVCFLAHENFGSPVIFAAFTIEEQQVIVKKKMDLAIQKILKSKGVNIVEIGQEEVFKEEERGDGYRLFGAFYIGSQNLECEMGDGRVACVRHALHSFNPHINITHAKKQPNYEYVTRKKYPELFHEWKETEK